MEVADIAADLAAEQESLDGVVAALNPYQWALATPSPGWDVSDQIGHLTYFDRAAALAITEPAGFSQLLAESMEAYAEGLEAFDAFTLQPYRAMSPDQLLAAWRAGRSELAAAAATLNGESRVAWYGPSMGAKSFLTARLMEAWAHGHDVCTAVGTARVETDRLRHVMQLGYITRGWAYQSKGLAVPNVPLRLELVAPDGAIWDAGPADATEKVAGPAVDFCLVTTQRRHLDDTELTVTPLAREWLLIAQTFAGPPTEGPPPGGRR